MIDATDEKVQVPQPEQPKVFVSYSRKDSEFAKKLAEALRARGLEPLIDYSGIYAFEEWEKRIKALIVAADAFVFVISPDAIASKICAEEIKFAYVLNKRLAPIVWRRVADDQVPDELARLNYIFVDGAADVDLKVDELWQQSNYS